MLLWYLARGAGITSFAALSVATGVGAFVSGRRPADASRRVVLQYIHRSAAMAGIVLLALHISMLVADSYSGVGLVGPFVPFASSYRPAAVTLGLLAMYLFVTVAVTGLLRSRFAGSERALRLWRPVHLLSYLAWVLSGWHFLTVGTDAGRLWARLVLLAGVTVVVAGLASRLTGPQLRRRLRGPLRRPVRIGEM
jgi:sulfoxide reductase heme-binding subunit YedZ